MKILIPTAVAVVALGAITVLTTAGWDRPPLSYNQTGFRGLAIEQGVNPRTQGPLIEANQSPAAPDPLPPSDAKPVSKVYKNVKVLGDVKEDAFLQLMTAMAEGEENAASAALPLVSPATTSPEYVVSRPSGWTAWEASGGTAVF